jgi:hypothetical protein
VKYTCLVFALILCGCANVDKLLGLGSGGGTPKNAVVSGAYTVVLTSTKANASTNIYVNMVTQTSASFSGTTNTLVCLGNAVANCVGNDAQVTVALIGTVSGNNVQIIISDTNSQGADTVTLTGTVSNGSISGTYTDSQGDSGTWTATQSSSVAGTLSGSINSTVNPLTIPPTVTAILASGQNFTLTGTAMIQNWQCFMSLNFSNGVAIGGAFALTDSTNNFVLLGVPTGAKTFNVVYHVSASSPTCAGDQGTGTLTLQ